MIKYLPMAIALAVGLTGCGGFIGDSITDQGGAPAAPPLILDGYGNPAPELQQAQQATQETPKSYMEWNSAEETREWHAAASRADCDRLEKALKEKGLDIRMVDRKSTGDPNLPWACIFEGNDADPNAVRFQDRRYENRDESEYP
jgi:hypothetical protein